MTADSRQQTADSRQQTADSRQQTADISSELSKCITVMKVICTLMIVIGHCTLGDLLQPNNINLSSMSSFSIFENFIIIFFWQSAVPVFFIMSGFLFYKKKRCYLASLKNKFRTILIPFLLWPSVFILIHITADIFGLTETHFWQWDKKGLIKMFVGFPTLGGSPHPFNGQFWYIRELIILYVFSPLIKKIVDEVPIFYFVLAFMFRISGLALSYEFGSAFLYFPLGYLLTKDNFKNIFNEMMARIKTMDLIFVYVLILFVETFQFVTNHVWISVISILNVFCGAVLLFRFSTVVAKSRAFNFFEKFAVYDFWIFAIHMPWLVPFTTSKIIPLFFPLQEKYLFAILFFRILITLTGSVVSGIICKKICPPVFAILTGGRKR